MAGQDVTGVYSAEAHSGGGLGGRNLGGCSLGPCRRAARTARQKKRKAVSV